MRKSSASAKERPWRRPACEVDFAPWLFGGNAPGLEEFCGWSMKPPERGGAWLVQTVESVHGDKPRLISGVRLANSSNAGTDGAYSRLNRLMQYDSYTRGIDRTVSIKGNQALLAKYPDNLAVALASIRGMTTISPTAVTLRHDVREALQTVLLPALPQSSVYFIETSERLSRRYGIARALLQTERPIYPLSDTELQFGSALGLFSDTTFGYSAYIDPLLTSLSPSVWGIASGRPGGVIVYLFGGLVEGLAGTPLEVISLYTPRSTRTSSGPIDLPLSSSFEAALQWWIGQLDRVFAAATDLSNYSRDGKLDPARQVERQLALEQLFRTCQSISASQRDPHARLTLMFTALDLLGGILPSVQWHDLVNASKARQVLERVQRAMPTTVGSVLIPRARLAIEALESLQSGFFVRSQLESGGIRLPMRDQSEVIPLERAVAYWLRVIRNSHHGFDQVQKPRERALLAAHNGNIPEALCDLVWFYLLSIVADPAQLNTHLTAQPTGEN